jgi:RES domain-containing protein
VAIPEQRFQGLVYRAHHPAWAWEPESGEGARRHGGRFNPKGTAALYLSLNFETAWAEAQQAFPFKPQPLTLCAYEVDCTGIVDLGDSQVLSALDVSHEDLGCAWEDLQSRSQTPRTHALAMDLISQGISGVIVTSFAPGAPAAARNLVLWRWQRDLPHRVRVIDDHGRLTRR